MMRALLSLLSPAGPRGKLTTLIFHRVLAEPDPLFPDEMDARRFDELCGWLARSFNVLPLDRAITLLSDGRLPARAMCITFDDGYEDNCSVALPILKRHGLPATFFIATGFLDGGWMWNDRVIESVRAAPGTTLDLRGVRGGTLGVYDLATPGHRRAAVDAILPKVKYLSIADRLEAVRQIADSAGLASDQQLMMSSSQVRQLHLAGMQLGAHTVNHPILATLTDSAASDEIRQSKETLEKIIGQPIRLLAYPNGKPGQDYGPAAVAIAKALGFLGAVSTAPGAAKRGTDRFQLPRFTPWDRAEHRFLLRLSRNLMAA